MTTDKSRSCRALHVLDGIATDEAGQPLYVRSPADREAPRPRPLRPLRTNHRRSLTMAATTTQTVRLIDCPACKGSVIANLTYDVKLNPTVYAEGAPIGLIDATATATLTLTGVRIQHECPPPKPISFFTEGGNPLARGGGVTTHNPVIREY